MEKRGFVEKSMFQKLQDRFCYLGNFYACCVDGLGNQITEWSGDMEEIAPLKEAVTEERLYDLFEKIRESALEEQIIEETGYGNLKAAAIGYKIEGKLKLCWLACCVFSEEETEGGKPVINGAQRITTEERVCETAVLLRMYAGHAFRTDGMAAKENGRLQKKTEYYTEALRLLECGQPFEEAAGRLLELMGGYLQITSAGLVKVLKDRQFIDIICEWLKEGSASDYDRIRNLERPRVFYGDKPKVISADSVISKEMKEYMREQNRKAIISIPLLLNEKPVMYVYFAERTQKKYGRWRKLTL